jgi:uncharacterized membrane protein
VATIPLDLAASVVAVALGVVAALFGGRALMILRSGSTGEAARELVFLNARDLVPPIGLVIVALLIEWVGWVVGALNAWGVVSLPAFSSYANVAQAIVLLIAGVMAFRVLVPYTRARRTEHARVMLDRLAARVALLRGRE